MPTITRTPEHDGFTTLGSENEHGDDYLLHIDSHQIGGTYYCNATDIKDGERWASYGPAGYSMSHRTREDAEQAQIDAHLANPGPALDHTPETAPTPPTLAPLPMTWEQALAEAKERSICGAGDPALMAALCDGAAQTLLGAVSPKLIWEGAQKQGLDTAQLTVLIDRDPMAACDLQWL